MEKLYFNSELDKAIENLTGTFIHKHTCQLWNKENKSYRPYGSGVLLETKQAKYIITAAHVTNSIPNNSNLYIQIGDGMFFPISGDLFETDLSKSKIDLCIIRLTQEFYNKLPDSYLFLPITKIRDHKKLLNAAQYCVMGYPEKSIVKTEKGKGTVAQAFYLKPANDKVFSYYNFNPSSFLILEMSGKGKNIKTDEKEKTESHLYGMSGGGIWLMIITKIGKEYKTDYRLIGIATEFKKSKYYVIIGVRINHLLSGLYHLGEVSIKPKIK